MSNNIAPYNQIWYAQTLVNRLFKRLVFVKGMYRDFDREARSPGDTIQFKRPGTFVSQTMPSATIQDLSPDSDTIKLDQWDGVQFGVRDDELAFTGDEIIKQHIDPAVQALAETMETKALALYKDIPAFVDAAGTINDFVNVRKALSDNNVAFAGRQLALNSTLEATYLAASMFANANTDADGGTVQREGALGRKMGIDSYSVPMLGSHATTAITVSTGTLATSGSVTGSAATPVKQLTLAATAVTGTIKKGDTLAVAGLTQRFAVTADATFAGNSVQVSITPAVPAGVTIANATAVTLRQQAKAISVAHVPDTFAIVTAPLSMAGDGRGAEVGVAIDPRTGLAVRTMRWYDPINKKHVQGFDILYGLKTVDPNKAVRLEV